MILTGSSDTIYTSDTIFTQNDIDRLQSYHIHSLEFRESDVSPGQTEVKQGNFVKFTSRAMGYLKKLINHKT